MKLEDLYEPLTEQELSEYHELLNWIQFATVNESLADLPAALKKKAHFIQEIAQSLGTTIKDLVVLFKDKIVFKFFSAIKWSLTNLYKLVRRGFALVHDISAAIGEYVSQTQVGQWSEAELKKLDDWLQAHPKLSRVAGVAVAGALIFIWLNMTFTGKFEYDFDLGDMIAALEGNFSLAQIFAGSSGLQLLTLFATGTFLGLSFPWPGATSVQFIAAVVGSLAKNRGIKKPRLFRSGA